jgi:hypothetical protein
MVFYSENPRAEFYATVTRIGASALASRAARPIPRTIMTTVSRLLLFSLVLLGSASAETLPWARLKIGMTADETFSLLGEPISSRRGHGFVTWTYDDGAEVLLHATGAVVGWTAPAAAAASARSADVWSKQPAGRYYASMHSVLPRPTRAPGRNGARAVRTEPAGTGYEAYLRG